MSDDVGSSVLTGGNPDPAPSAEPVAAPQEAAPADWRSKLPEGLRAHTALSKFNSEEAMATAYVNLERYMGTDKVPIPKEGDTEGWELFYKAAGRPEAPDKYDFKVPEGLPEGFYNEEVAKGYRTIAHKLGLNQHQAAGLHDYEVAARAQANAEYAKMQQQAKEDCVHALKREQGAAYDGFMQTAKAALKQFGDEEYNAFLDSTGMGNDPRLLRVFGRIGKALMGDTQLKGDPGQNGARTPQQVSSEIEEFRATHSKALLDVDHPEYMLRRRQLQQKYDELYPAEAKQ